MINKTTTKTKAKTQVKTRIVSSLNEVGQAAWDGLLALQADANPFLSFAFLHALHESGSASEKSGWQPQYLTLWEESGDPSCNPPQLIAALPLYVKFHSYGEYVFDWAWADAYQRNGLEYYPKLLSAIPFTPVTGGRLLARDEQARAALIEVLRSLRKDTQTSSTHILYPPAAQAEALQQAGFMLRSGVQFHWLNPGYRDFTAFLDTLERKKRKNILAERRKVADAGVRLRRVRGTDATEADWIFFNRCYAQTYAEHHSTPYLNLDFFLRIATSMPQNILLIVAERDGRPIASSLLIHTDQTLYGRYWGALEFVPCLHFETAYYQPLEFCIEQKIACFEGGAQGEHKMARGFLPQKTWSAHWLAHPAFADAVANFLEREADGIDSYMDELNDRNPFRSASS
ncbi:MAG: N-acetyltransferase [Collimonas fungivorans]|uniref:GNAT family N-acetyltransferase n=1 Tax=Collimonas fungivorans TaxID=158899 RepID=UPI0026F2AE13|nr:GNAT family N-acetyltransferase [Collimonas fungivorans]MDB5766632.1 N-acetyltransferase [Collimonas fungivorans]